MGNSLSPKVGGPGGKEFTFQCKDNAYINKVVGRSGALVDGIQLHCTDGAQSDWFGGQGGAEWTELSPSGFTGFDGRGGLLVDNIQLRAADGTLLKARGGSGGSPMTFTCPSGQKIVGATGGAGTMLDRIQFGCKTIAAAVADGAAAAVSTPAQPVTAAVPTASPAVADAASPTGYLTPPPPAEPEPVPFHKTPGFIALVVFLVLLFAIVIAVVVVNYTGGNKRYDL